jgi:hypothetical protein
MVFGPRAEAAGQVQLVSTQALQSRAPSFPSRLSSTPRSPALRGFGVDEMDLPRGFSPGLVVVLGTVFRLPDPLVSRGEPSMGRGKRAFRLGNG